jgi:Lrp/AsnC family leucine-responsive transcriptional regulator
MKLDDLNWKILESLQVNARQSNTELAKKIGISSNAVAERIKKMEEQGTIKGYTANLSFEKVGYQLKTIITIKPAIDKYINFIKEIRQQKEVINCFRVTGDESYYVEAIFVNYSHLEFFLDKMLGYGLTTTYVVLSEVTYNRAIARKEDLTDYHKIEK